MIICANCGAHGNKKFCSECGQVLKIERIKLPAVLHEVVHVFTHFEKGFLYTIKQLAYHPGKMQNEYLSGMRAKHQKPFPVFAITGAICAVALYLIYKSSPDITNEEYFFKNYYVLVQASLLPCYALSTWILFKNSKLYYAEILVMVVYMVAFMSLIIIPINALHRFFNGGIITLIEIIVLTFYNVWTYLNFFNNKRKWLTIIKSVLNIVVNYILFQIVGNLVIRWFM